MIRSLNEAVGAREPLIEIVVRFKEGVDYDLATAAVNSLGPDINLRLGHWYGDPRLRIGAVTAEGRSGFSAYVSYACRWRSGILKGGIACRVTSSNGVQRRSLDGRTRLLHTYSQSAHLSQAQMMMVDGTSLSSRDNSPIFLS